MTYTLLLSQLTIGRVLENSYVTLPNVLRQKFRSNLTDRIFSWNLYAKLRR